jgi:hypothetical protein
MDSALRMVVVSSFFFFFFGIVAQNDEAVQSKPWLGERPPLGREAAQSLHLCFGLPCW